MEKSTVSLTMRSSLRAAGGMSSLLGAIFFLCTPVQAEEASSGIKWTFDGELSQGVMWRASARNNALVGPSNGGTDMRNLDLGDDGNLNYPRKGQVVASPASFLGTVEGEFGNQRVLVRGSLMYDWKNNDFSRLSTDAREIIGKRARLLDAYWAGTFNTGEESNMELKLGRQVIMWGESKMLPGGINYFNPLDFSRLRQPGSTLKDGALPVGAAAVTLVTGPTVTLQGFYQLERAEQELDPVGSFFSDVDILGAGAGTTTIAPFVPLPLSRIATRRHSRSGQFGVAAFVKLDYLGLGFYYQNLTQRTARTSGYGNASAPFGVPQTSYLWEYPKDIETVGVSFNTKLGKGALTGEVAYRRNVPIGLDGGAMGTARANAALCVAALGMTPDCPVAIAGPTPLKADATGYIKGYAQIEQLAFNLGYLKFFTGSDAFISALGANGGSILLEASAIRSDMPNQMRLPTLVTDKWHGSGIASLGIDYLRVNGSDWAITPKLVVQTWYLGDEASGAPFFKGRLQVTPALQFRRENPDISFELSYTSTSDHSHRGDRVLSDRDYVAATARFAF